MRSTNGGWARLMGLACVGMALAACGGGGSDPAPPDATLPGSVQLKVPTSASVDAELALASQEGVAPGVTYQWTFGDGSSSAERAPTHRYAKAGDYEITLTLTGGGGQRMSASASVSVRHFANVDGTLCSGPGASGWCWQRPRPSGNTVAAVAFADAGTGWAVGDLGMILKSTDGGISWAPQKSGVNSRLTAVAFADAQVAWAIGENAVVLKTVDGGATWLRQVLPPVADYAYYNTLGSLRVLSRDIVVISLPNNYYDTSRGYVTMDGGQTWTPHGGAVPQQITADGGMWSYNGYDTVQSSPDLGKTWTRGSLPGMSGYSYGGRLSAIDGLHAVVVALSSKTPGDYTSQVPMLWLTNDGGQTWAQSAPAELNRCTYYWCHSVSAVLLQPGGVIWAITDGQLSRSADWGENWQPVTTPTSVEGASIKASPDGRVALLNGNTAYISGDAGATWRTVRPAQESSAYSSLTQFGVVDPQHVWMQYGERLYVSGDAGASFTRSLGPAPEDAGTTVLAAWFFDAREGIALTSSGWMQRTTDGGRTWTRTAVSIGASTSSARMQFVSRKVGWLTIAGTATLLQTTDGGLSWVSSRLGDAARGVRDFQFLNATDGWAVDQDGQVFKTGDAGATWARLATAPSMAASLVRFGDADTGVLASGSRMMHTTDGGKTWAVSQTGVGGLIQKLQFTSKNDAWALTTSGMPIHSTDGGRTWNPIAAPAGQTFQNTFFTDMQFLDADHAWLVAAGGLVLSTADGGRSWALQDAGSRADLRSVFFTDPYTGWVFGNNGVILATATGG